MSLSLVTIFIVTLLSVTSIGLRLVDLIGFSQLNRPLRFSVAYGLGVLLTAQIILLLAQLSLSLRAMSWAILVIGAVIGLSRTMTHHSVTSLFHRVRVNYGVLAKSPLKPYPDVTLTLTLLALLGAHVVWALHTSLLQPDFPWDAFTTWLYRAKLWVLYDNIQPLTPVADWLSSGAATGHAIYAHKYPETLSVYVAFVSALTGDWSPAIISLTWCSIYIAICASVFGLLITAGTEKKRALIGAYLIGALPLLNTHAALYGYGDLWLCFFSGGGLALLLVWSMRGNPQLLILAAVMLLAGTQFKSEGWLWLIMGTTFAIFIGFANRYGYRSLILALSLLIGGFWLSDISHLNLGALGQWGIEDRVLHAGALGSYPLRPLNPAGSYFNIIFQQLNFLFLGLAYLAALLALVATQRAGAIPFLILGGMIAISQYGIFGLSVYSRYAETGTAITRLLLHFLPVAVVTSVIAWQALIEKLTTHQRAENLRAGSAKHGWSVPRLLFGTATFLLAALAAPFALLALQTPSASAPTGTWSQANDLTPIVGEVRPSDDSVRFISSPMSVGVLAGPMWDPKMPQPQFLLADTRFERAGAVSFYWVQADGNAIHSSPIELSGRSIIDLNRFKTWSDQPVKEYGYLVKNTEFGGTEIKALGLESHLALATLPWLLNHWNAAEALSQRLINNSVGHFETPLNLASFLNVSFLLITVAGALLGVIWRGPEATRTAGCALLLIWGLGDVMAIKNSGLNQKVSSANDQSLLSLDDPSGQSLSGLTGKIDALLENTTPIVIVSLDEGTDFASQKLPFLLLPKPAISLTSEHDRSELAAWSGALVILGNDEVALDNYTERLTGQTGLERQLRWQAEGARIISP